jgi:hypothetical protein
MVRPLGKGEALNRVQTSFLTGLGGGWGGGWFEEWWCDVAGCARVGDEKEEQG